MKNRTKNVKSLFKAVALITVFSVITRALGFIFRIFLSRKLGGEGMGIYQVALSFFGTFNALVVSGIPVVLSRLVAKYDVTNKKASAYSAVTAGLIISVSIALMLSGTLLLFRELFSKMFTDERCLAILITLLPALVASGVYATLRGYLWGEKNFFSVCVTELAEQILRIVFYYLIIKINYLGIL